VVFSEMISEQIDDVEENVCVERLASSCGLPATCSSPTALRQRFCFCADGPLDMKSVQEALTFLEYRAESGLVE